jgi:diguanylate cyclase (GGDEF)-like protein/PAS domain S-box-containing protein
MHEPTSPLSLNSPQELHQVLFDIMNDGVMVVSQDGVIVDCNPTFHQRLGYAKEELVGMSVTTLDPPEFAARVPKRLAQIREQGQATFETAHYRRDGSIMPVELSARFFYVNGELVFFSIVRDISERKVLEQRLQEGLDIYQAAINTSALGFWALNATGQFMEVNEAYVQHSGYSREELLRMNVPDVEAMQQPEDVAARIEEIINTSGYARFRSAHRRKNGTVWPVEIITTFSPIQGGLFFVFIEDLTEKVTQEGRLQMASLVFETMNQAVVVTDASNRIVTINPATTLITGYTLDEVKGQDPKIFASGRHDHAFYAAMWQSLQTDGHWEGEIWDRRKDGEVYPKWLTLNVIKDAHGNTQQYVSVFSDITERKKTEELIWRQANFDSLTGLPNRHLLHERLEQELKKAQRANYPLAVLFIDLDRFKEINDTLGHAKGDALLVQAARRLSARVRDTDTIARLGGDEFTVVLPEFGNRLNLERIVLELIHELAEPYDLGDNDLGYVSASVGITLYPDDAHSLEDLLKHADQAMYVAKAEGRDRYSYFTASMQQEVRQKLALTKELRLALSRQQLALYFQPIVDLKSGEITKAEALLRWVHPERGMISPEIFIPLAEDSGLIHEIGEWVFREAICCVKGWQQRFGRTIQMSINKSPLQFERLIEPSWSQQLIEHGLEGNSITVEITEGSLLSKSERLKERLLEFHSAGIEISIDDFGTGFSALSYLHRFDIDYLKIDRSFIMDLAENDAHTALTEAIIVMAHKLGIKTIAEGVETAQQRDLLKTFGCDYAQGYLYSRPVPTEEFEQLLDHNKNADRHQEPSEDD